MAEFVLFKLINIRDNVRYYREYIQFSRMSRASGSRFPMPWKSRKRIIIDWTPNTAFEPHYHYHTAWAARILKKENPPLHVDISSSLMFVGMVSAFLEIDFYDYRPATIKLDNLNCKSANLTNLHFPDDSIPSLSCMHVVEHVGLGRYVDPLAPDGDLNAMSELARVLQPGGKLLFVTPVGYPRIEYNAHRVYTKEMILEAFEGLQLIEFAFVADDPSEGLLIDPPSEFVNSQKLGCGCFLFTK